MVDIYNLSNANTVWEVRTLTGRFNAREGGDPAGPFSTTPNSSRPRRSSARASSASAFRTAGRRLSLRTGNRPARAGRLSVSPPDADGAGHSEPYGTHFTHKRRTPGSSGLIPPRLDRFGPQRQDASG